MVVVAAVAGFFLSRAGRPAPSPTTPPVPTPLVLRTPLPTQPASDFGYALVDDPATRRVILFGGVNSYDATWLWDGSHWTFASPTPRPSGRYGGAAAYDPTMGLVLLFGGRMADGELLSDTWSGDGTSWHELSAGGAAAPAATELAAMAWDDATRQMVLVIPSTPVTSTSGGKTWVWAGRWVQQPGGALPAAALGGVMAYDPGSKSLLLVSASGATLSWNGRAWRRLPVPAVAHGLAGLALDPTTARLIAIALPDQQPGAGKTWEWSREGWTAPRRASVPAASNAELVTDVSRQELLLVGSSRTPTQMVAPPLHVWRWSAGGWSQVT